MSTSKSFRTSPDDAGSRLGDADRETYLASLRRQMSTGTYRPDMRKLAVAIADPKTEAAHEFLAV